FIAKASADETMDHLETLWDTKSLTNLETYENLSEKVDKLNRKLYTFIETVKREHNSF
ncbi:MAG: four helix bundle protein, partial [Bacteroidia bacterium]|nr:four helix bundle protein [Bacteroidia bacterium]